MRQACCDPRLLKLKTVAKSKAGSAKLDRLMEMLSIMFAEGRRVLLFSQFTEMLALIEARLQEDEVKFVKLTGDTKDRATPVKKFQAGDVPLFLISLKAGGVGLNLTAADTVIHYDPWWNPAVEDQATDRAHRIGQTKKVFVHRLVTLGTIEEKMEVLKEKKRAIVASVMDTEHGGALTHDRGGRGRTFWSGRVALGCFGRTCGWKEFCWLLDRTILARGTFRPARSCCYGEGWTGPAGCCNASSIALAQSSGFHAWSRGSFVAGCGPVAGWARGRWVSIFALYC